MGVPRWLKKLGKKAAKVAVNAIKDELLDLVKGVEKEKPARSAGRKTSK
jgi:hypothetical protein